MTILMFDIPPYKDAVIPIPLACRRLTPSTSTLTNGNANFTSTRNYGCFIHASESGLTRAPGRT
jgi:hypothetical protein